MPSLQNEPVTEGFEEDEGEGYEDGEEERNAGEADADGHSNGSDEPDIRGSREADNVIGVMDEGSGTEEADPCHNLRSDA